MSDAPAPHSLSTAPLIGPIIRSFYGEDAPLAWLVLVLVLGVVLVAVFGYAALILLSLVGTFVVLAGLVLITRAR